MSSGLAKPEEYLSTEFPAAGAPAVPHHANSVLVAADRLEPVERFQFDRERRVIVRTVARRDGTERESIVHVDADIVGEDLGAAFDLAWLTSRERPKLRGRRREIRLVDLFSGCGGMTVGVEEACRALGLRLKPLLAVDIDATALDIYQRNIPVESTSTESVEALLDSELGSPLSMREQDLREQIGRVDILVGGPPCQGHSDLNNHTRRSDTRNALFLKMARFAEVCEPDHIIIENVLGVRYDSGNVFERTRHYLQLLGYSVDGGILRTDQIGVPQTRPRVLLVASKCSPVTVSGMAKRFRTPPRSFMWACADLIGLRSDDPYDRPAGMKSVTAERINHLFDNDLYELPDEHRPSCHREKRHTYPSVYGRIRPWLPAPTITTGFMTMGQGRFVHPEERRTLTAHEGARIQTFPDWFRFGSLSRQHYLRLIGNAVPPKLAYAVALELLR